MARVAVLGAGCIGQWVGGHLALRGVDVLLVGKGLLGRTVDSGRLRLTDVERDAAGFDESLPLPGHPHLAASFDMQEAFQSDDFLAVFVCLKLGDNDLAASLGKLKKDTVIVSMQNGIGNKKKLAKLLPEHPIVGGMVPYGVIEAGPGHMRRATFGPIVFDDSMPPTLTAALRGAGLAVEVVSEADAHAEQCFKLVVNCHNALNALRGKPLVEASADRLYRELMASTWEEALEVLRRSGQPLRGTMNGMPMERYLRILRLPNFALNAVKRLKPGLAPDPQYHSSMFYDLEQRRRTEIEELNGLVVKMAADAGVPCPVNTALARLVREAEAANAGSPRLSPEALFAEIRKEAPAREGTPQTRPFARLCPQRCAM
ncbi:unnamed protein product [Symbiodinium natans]|uniref:2-dehydropantoate 2-reductase n=1 Tax=Symbiodinium natans TaxID=878477 RepID=A0A812IG31_9DINO|nr:unnamed protein product [Symbiodinium natans]